MFPQKSKRLAWFVLPAFAGIAIFIWLLLLFPQLTKAQSSLEFTVSPAESSILPGTNVAFVVAITNTGAISLTNIVVNSNDIRSREAYAFSNCLVNPISIFNPSTSQQEPLVLGIGESYSYSCSNNLFVDVQMTFLLSAEATDNSSTVANSADVAVHVEHLSASFGSEYQAVSYGDTAPLTLYLTNSGDYDLTALSVTPRDAAYADCARAIGTLPDLPGKQATSFSCASPNLFEDAEIVFDVAATLNGSTAVSEVAYLFLDSIKGLALEISPDNQLIPANSTADLTITLKNPDTVPVTNLAVTSADFPACTKAAGSLPDLPGGESYTYQCQSPELTTDDTYTLTASATSNGLAVTAVAATTINANSQIDIDVTPKNLIVAENTLVTFTITVTNHLITDTLTNVAVNTTPVTVARDSEKPSGGATDCAGALADLAPGQVITYTCQRIAFPGEPNQTFTVSGFTPAEFEDSDDGYQLAATKAYIGLVHTFLPVTMNNYQRPFTQPDLIIDQITIDQISNDTFSLNITVKNQSTLPVNTGNNFYVNAYDTSNLNSPIFVCSVQGQWLGAGQGHTCSGQITLTSGRHTIRAWADPYNTVTEEYEANNTKDFQVTHD